MIPYKNHLKKISQSLRKNTTQTEKEIWGFLRKKQIHGIQFYRQKPLCGFIVDFYAPQIKLVIEIDGSQHYEEQHQEKDKKRDEILGKYGIAVLRFNNHEIATEKEAVVDVISNEVEKRL